MSSSSGTVQRTAGDLIVAKDLTVVEDATVQRNTFIKGFAKIDGACAAGTYYLNEFPTQPLYVYGGGGPVAINENAPLIGPFTQPGTATVTVYGTPNGANQNYTAAVVHVFPNTDASSTLGLGAVLLSTEHANGLALSLPPFIPVGTPLYIGVVNTSGAIITQLNAVYHFVPALLSVPS